VIFGQVSDCGLEKLWTFSFWLDFCWSFGADIIVITATRT
jgi:hypothetical protein